MEEGGEERQARGGRREQREGWERLREATGVGEAKAGRGMVRGARLSPAAGGSVDRDWRGQSGTRSSGDRKCKCECVRGVEVPTKAGRAGWWTQELFLSKVVIDCANNFAVVRGQ